VSGGHGYACQNCGVEVYQSEDGWVRRIGANTRHNDQCCIENLKAKLGMPPYTALEVMGGVMMLLWCPGCGERHIDEGEFATKAHHTHACQNCGMCWRPAVVPTCGVQFLPGFKNAKEGT
jgi:predicted RNA-binding Zn-ribbon protein involved in translation (DUF1610 family)